MIDADEVLNTVDKPPFPCPTCDHAGPMYVLVDRVVWFCGHSRPLPPMRNSGRDPLDPNKKLNPVGASRARART